ncbi:hypothetical protein [Bradyrhizobium sp. 33ap4]|uniref:hypothetical protein n=1 Tax=Bradyrhizobium sp. 33ap4 TaxID=3061630 RepID=UPI00292D8DDF|nr:hypothetical protein [Bradyrhizobium sp. 33ap4]
MARYYYEHVELIDDTWTYAIYDRRLGSEQDIARCDRGDDAERIVAALNVVKPKVDVFG